MTVARKNTEDACQFRHLNTPPGEAGSGKVRYAAAMYFHQRGWLSDAALEVYRAFAKDDWSDPRALLEAAGEPAEIAELRLKLGFMA